ncbi:MAG: transcription termination/antitermination protein NusG [Christensenellales bacterium]
MQYCYCLFCETSKCRKVAFLLEKNGLERAFSPQIVRRQRKKGKNIELMFDLLPGYVFAYSSQPVKEMSQLKVDGVIRLLGSPENSYCLIEKDQLFALNLLERNGLIDVLNLLQIGDTVTLSDELFLGYKGKVVQIDYRKQRAKVLFDFAGVSWNCWVACNLIFQQYESVSTLPFDC